ncbi:peptidylprolyl isomerase [Kordia sp. YSTF-M3]|uniref:peptidylprolyl isomerase n=1 Tax=Kordia aestuariivivens TaxID=2759037 RepID=A0ABR7Q5F6_9FLAO|nr:peptidylprolyl isomerase [Kordia aestuariivivens]MBC8753753.1 peptidylprolyl isomerase [Kordia aestuariivivens]
MKKITLLMAIIALGFTACKSSEYVGLADGIYADIQTSKGPILVELNYKETPVTSANFIGLAKGTHPQLVDSLKGKPFYDGLIFHRVMKNFMIQTGDPLGTGMGNPGYKFDSELIPTLNHDQAGTLAMANSGPNTNGSQFYITHVPYPSLNGRYVVFGNVVIDPVKEKELRAEISDTIALQKAIDVAKMETVDAIANVTVSTDPNTKNRPLEDVKMISVKIIRVGSEAKAFDEVKVFSNQYAEKVKAMEKAKARAQELLANKEKATKKFIQEIKGQKGKATKLPSGLGILYIKKGDGKKPNIGEKVSVEYAGYLENGTLLDATSFKLSEEFGQINERKLKGNGYDKPMVTDYSNDTDLIAGFKEGLLNMRVGDKVRLFIPSHLAWGERGAGGMIPPNADVIFDIELIK